MEFCLTSIWITLLGFAEMLLRGVSHIQSLLMSVSGSLPSQACCTVKRANDFQILGWLTILPLVCHQFDLSLQQFCDVLSLPYHSPLQKMPSSCDGCGNDFSLSHVLDCQDGLVTQCTMK